MSRGARRFSLHTTDADARLSRVRGAGEWDEAQKAILGEERERESAIIGEERERALSLVKRERESYHW